jgi:hypothetical protein
MLGNSGKPVTLETSRLMKFVMQVFRGKELTKIWSLELTNHEVSKSRMRGELDSRTLGVANVRWLGILNLLCPEVANSWRLKAMNPRSHELRECAKFRNMMEDEFRNHGAWGFPEREHSPTSKKQSQSCSLKKSGFNVWTSGRLVNVWDVKDICVCVHTRNILWVQGYCRNVKVTSSPYKRGAWGHV